MNYSQRENHTHDQTKTAGPVVLAVRQDAAGALPGATDGQYTLLQVDGSGNLRTTMAAGSNVVDTELPAAAALADGTPNPTVPAVGAFGHVWTGAAWNRQQAAGTAADASGLSGGSVTAVWLWNGNNFDRWRNNQSLTLLSSAARTATLSSSDQVNYNHSNLLLIVNVSVVGTGSITPSLQVKDSISGNYFTIWTAAAAIVTGATFAYYFGNGATGGSYTEKIASQIAGRTWRLTMTHNNANSITYSASADQLV